MNPLSVNRPIRLQADLTPPPGLTDMIGADSCWFTGDEAADGIKAIAGSSLFFLQLGYPPREEDYHDLFLEFIRSSAAKGIKVSLIIADNHFPLKSLADAGVKEVIRDLTVSSDDEKKLKKDMDEFCRAFDGISDGAMKAGALFRLNKRNLSSLSRFIKAFGNAGIDFIELPPQPLVYYHPREAALTVLAPGDYHIISEILKETVDSLAQIKDIRVHDILIWSIWENIRSIRGSGDSRFQGCQAAIALCYVSPEGVVYPCSSIRRPLGRVGELGDEDFWRKPAVSAVRNDIALMIESCQGCRALEECRGGCPGVITASEGGQGEEDPLCRFFMELIAGGQL